MTEDDDPIDLVKVSYEAPTTRKLFKLTPALVGDLSRPSRQTATVAAKNEEDARLFAADADPFNHEWRNPLKFVCDAMETSQDHVIGDVIFRSLPVHLPKILRPKGK